MEWSGDILMSIEFDPAWEYFVGDPEIEEMTQRLDARSLFDLRVDQRFMIVSKLRSGSRVCFSSVAKVFATLWLAGHRVATICQLLDIRGGATTVMQWRIRLGLPSRMSGNHPREQQVAYMRRQLDPQ